jgi:hypothetical protein
MYDFVIT